MTTQELKKYLSMVVDMEKSIYMQERLLKRIQTESANLCIRHEFVKPTTNVQTNSQNSTGCGTAIFLVIGGPIIALGSQLFKGSTWQEVKASAPWISALAFAGVAMTIIGIIMGIKALGQKSENDKENRKAEKSYQVAIRNYNEQIAAQEARIARETPKKLTLQAQERQVEREIIKSRDVLSKLYSYNIIYPKYRKLEFVCSLYEYLCAGRCTTLEGHEGGYNILEKEIRLDHIISQVDRVINNLNSIKYSQAQLYDAVMDSNQKLDRIISSTEYMASQVSYLGNQTSTINSRLADLQKSSDLTAYYTERNSKHLEYMNWMNYRSGAYKDAGYYNAPPSY